MVPVAAALVAWGPLTRNFFLRDDWLHFFDATTLPASEFLAQLWGGHLYVVRNAILLVTLQTFGPDPRPFFWTMLLTHLVNVALCWAAIRRFTRNDALACFGATLWGTCATLEGTLGWYSVYGQVLLTTMVLAVLTGLGALATSDRPLTLGRAVLWALLLIVGSASFGFGLGMAVVFPFVVWVVLPARQRSAGALVVLALAAVVVVTTYLVLRAQVGADDPNAKEVLSVHAMLTTLPSTLAFEAYLLGVGAAALMSALVGIDGAHWVAATLFPLGFATVIAGAFVRGVAADRRRLVAIAFLIVVAYATVGVGRTAVLNTSSYPLEVAATWVRYHYFPLALLVLLGCMALGVLARDRGPVMSAAVVAWTVARLAVLLISPFALSHHDAERTQTESALARIRAIVATTPPGQVARIDNEGFRPMSLHGLFPGLAALFIVSFPDNVVDGRPVRFLVSPATLDLARRRGGRLAELVEPRPGPTTSSVP